MSTERPFGGHAFPKAANESAMARPARASMADSRLRTLPWWVRPSAINLLFLLPLLLLVLWAGMSGLGGSAVRANIYLSWEFAALCVAMVLASAGGAWLGEQLRQQSVVHSDDAHLRRIAIGVGVLVLATYLFWYRALLFNPATLISILTGGPKPEREDIGTVTGITSLVNLAPLYFGLAGYLLFLRKRRDPVLFALTVVLLLFTLFRNYIWSERLAVMEAGVPLAFALLGSEPPPTTHRIRYLVWRIGPYAAVPLVFVFFSVSEYFRSWPYYKDDLPFWEFSLARFAAYYVTSLNNGAAILATTPGWPDGTFQSVLNWLHRFPLGIGDWFSESVGLVKFAGVWGPDPALEFLERLGDPEFNTASAFGTITLDLGVPGALLYSFFTMFCAGILYARYARGDTFALMLFPSVPVALFECFRYPYYGTSRAVVWLLGALIVMGLLWISGGNRAAKPSNEPLGRAALS